MKTDVITVSSRGRKMEKALEQADKMAAYKGLSGKNALHLRLLTEEMMSMMRSITGETEGKFWIEDENGTYALHLQVNTRMDTVKRDQLLSASTSGKNDSARGLMGRLRDLFDRSADSDLAAVSSPFLHSGMMDHADPSTLGWEWSMVQYESVLNAGVQRNDDEAREAWDELEKSVVARVADEVKVAIRGQTVEMTIFKAIA